MKAYYDHRPEPIENLGFGRYFVNMNIHEIEVGTEIEGETRVEWECDQVEIVGEPTYKSTVVALITERYDENDQLALLFDQNRKDDEMSEYQQFRAECKAMARQVFPQ